MDEILSEEEQQELRQQAENGIHLDAMLHTAGWQDILMPMLKGRREAALAGLLNVDCDLNKFVSAQQCFNTFNFVLKYVDGIVESGKQASQRLEQHKSAEKEAANA